MGKELFLTKSFRADALELIDSVNVILDEYAEQGYTLTLRQVYYQLVARGMVPNTVASYKRIGDVVSDGRLAGMIDWDHIEDRARETVTPTTWSSPTHIIRSAASQYRIDRWKTQPVHIELLVEKQALEGVLEPVANKYGIPFTANKGYLSQSMMYRIAERIDAADARGKDIALLYLGDHDPSGLDMDRDIGDRLALFTREAFDIKLTRLALTMGQVKKYNPPKNPAKITDSRADRYIREFGASSWELDALEPSVLVKLVSEAIGDVIDWDSWDESGAREEIERKQLEDIANNMG